MKIHQLPLGAQFEFEGVVYVKCGPMVANGPSGQRLIPKYAVLKALTGETPPAPLASARMLSEDTVLNAFATFYAYCESITTTEQHSTLALERQRFIASLKP